MIISASRRTDIPAFYSEWFINRIKEEYLYVRNPMNIHQIGKINLSPSVVDGIVFWTKNPIPMMEKLDKIKKYPYYFQFTLTAYGRDIEIGLPSKNKELIPAFCELSKMIGKERIIWRYDPIFINDTYSVEYHKRYFKTLASKLGAYTEKCTVSFLDMYKNTIRNIQPLGIRIPTREEQIDIGTYNTCKNGCVYCYANYSRKTVNSHTQCHDPYSPLLFGRVGEDDVIKERKMTSLIERQMSLFDFNN